MTKRAEMFAFSGSTRRWHPTYKLEKDEVKVLAFCKKFVHFAFFE